MGSERDEAVGAPSRRRRILFKLILLGFSITISLVVIEIGMRIVMPSAPENRDPQVGYVMLDVDPAAGRKYRYWHLKPDQEAYTFDAPLKSDSIGLRNDTIRADLPAGHIRVAALGDSHTFGQGVSGEETWPRILEASLKKAWPEASSDVINAGIGGLGIEQELELFEDLVAPLKPRVVVLAYYWNDMPVRLPPEAELRPGETMVLPRSAVPKKKAASSGARSSQAEPSAFMASIKKLAKKSYLLYYLVQKIPALQMATSSSDMTAWKRYSLEGGTTPRMEAAWAFVDSQFERFRRLADEHGFEPVLVTIPIFEQMISDDYGRAGYQDYVARLAKKHRIHAIDPLKAIRAIEPSYPRDFVPFDGHPTGRIYAVVADEVARCLGTLRLK